MSSQVPEPLLLQGAAIKTFVLTREANCTHSSFAREYSTYDHPMICLNCNREPDLGWVYACTEDRDRHGILAEYWERFRLTSTGPSSNFETGDAIHLNDWVAKAIESGHYTSEQVERIKAQRAEVLKAINTYHRVNHNSSRALPPLPPQELRDPEQVSKDTCADVTTDLLPPTECGSLATVYIPSCHLRVCHTCLPIAAERSWLSINRVCTSGNISKDQLLESLIDVGVSVDDAFFTRRIQEMESLETGGRPNCDIADESVWGGEYYEYYDEHGGSVNSAACAGNEANADGDSYHAVLRDYEMEREGGDDGNDADEATDEAYYESRSLSKVLHLHWSHVETGVADETTTPFAQQMRSKNRPPLVPPRNSRSAHSLSRKAKFKFTVQPREWGVGGDSGDLGLISIDKLLDTADGDIFAHV
ncbi:hypothetical protein PABG_05017 [Paracoccidioides brasiliensis Pb03]|nr:hypothetical protein PABG_05017 [Paracoccidioides brasiliensis Pb03]